MTVVNPLGGGSDLRARTVMGIGDSITSNGGTACADSRNHVAQAVIASGGRLVYSVAAGTSGLTAAQVLSTHVPTALASRAGIVFVLAGTNDIATGVSQDTTAANLLAIYQQLMVKGKVPVACSIPPNSTGWTSAQRKQLRALNLWIASTANRLGIPFADYFAALADPITGLYASGLSGDSTHPNGNGGVLMGPVAWAAISPYVPAGSVPLMAYGDSAGGAASGNMLDNPLALRVTTLIPDGFSLAGGGGTATLSQATGKSASWLGGKAVRCVTADSQVLATTVRAFTNSNGTVVAGQLLAFGFRCAWTPATNARLSVYLLDQQGNVNLAGFQAWDVAIPDGSVWWQEALVPVGTTTVEPRAKIDNNGTTALASTVDWSQVTAHNLTALVPVLS